MSTAVLPSPTPSPTSSSLPSPTGSTFAKGHKRCHTCTPTDGHLREWMPDPDCRRERDGRTLVLCFDGTGDSFDADNSNVVQFLSMLMKDDPAKQLVYYQAGIGTYTSNVLKTPITETVSKTMDMMLALNINDHVKEGYLFLMQNYHFGDQICIFGFSRGAYTARALAGMVQKIGLLPRFNLEQFPFAYDMYKRHDKKGLDLCEEFKRTFSIDVRIKFLGVWDTVESVGVVPKDLPFSGTNSSIWHFRHAVALDEHRVKFIPSFYVDNHCNSENGRYERKVNKADKDAVPTDFKEVFFAGAHCDVGGGSVENGTRHSLARIPLRWMIRECFKTKTGIIFDGHMLKHVLGLDTESIKQAPPLPSPPLPSPRPSSVHSSEKAPSESSPTSWHRPLSWIVGEKSSHDKATKDPKPPYKGEGQEELDDAHSPIYDQLKMHWYWKAMEYVPWLTGRHGDQHGDSKGSWRDRIIYNKRKGRIVYQRVMRRTMKVHRSVRVRIEASGQNGTKEYLPKIRCSINGTIRRLTREEWLAEPPVHFEWVDVD